MRFLIYISFLSASEAARSSAVVPVRSTHLHLRGHHCKRCEMSPFLKFLRALHSTAFATFRHLLVGDGLELKREWLDGLRENSVGKVFLSKISSPRRAFT